MLYQPYLYLDKKHLGRFFSLQCKLVTHKTMPHMCRSQTLPPQKYVYVLAFRAHYTLKRKIVPIACSTLLALFLVFASLLASAEPFCPYKSSVIKIGKIKTIKPKTDIHIMLAIGSKYASYILVACW